MSVKLKYGNTLPYPDSIVANIFETDIPWDDNTRPSDTIETLNYILTNYVDQVDRTIIELRFDKRMSSHDIGKEFHRSGYYVGTRLRRVMDFLQCDGIKNRILLGNAAYSAFLDTAKDYLEELNTERDLLETEIATRYANYDRLKCSAIIVCEQQIEANRRQYLCNVQKYEIHQIRIMSLNPVKGLEAGAEDAGIREAICARNKQYKRLGQDERIQWIFNHSGMTLLRRALSESAANTLESVGFIFVWELCAFSRDQILQMVLASYPQPALAFQNQTEMWEIDSILQEFGLYYFDGFPEDGNDFYRALKSEMAKQLYQAISSEEES